MAKTVSGDANGPARRRTPQRPGFPAPEDFLLKEKFGDQPGLLLDSAGAIVAVNEQAALLLGRSRDDLCGTQFGLWASRLSHVDLDLIRSAGGVTCTTAVRAMRAELPGETHVPVVLRELPDSAHTALVDAVVSGLIAAGALLGVGTTSVGPLPDVSVPAPCRDAMKAAVLFTVRLAGIGTPKLHVSLGGTTPDWVEVHISVDLSQGEPRGADGEVEFPEFQIPGLRCGLIVDFPRMDGVLRIPYREPVTRDRRAA